MKAGGTDGSRRRFLALAGLPGATVLGVENQAAPRARRTPPAALVDVTRFGAVGDGRGLCTVALQKAIDACAALGGGTVVIPRGRYLTGALFLRSHLRLDFATGATLVASDKPEHFPAIRARDEGIERTIYAGLLTGLEVEHVAITGDGVIEGQGGPWWTAYEATLKMRLDAHLPREVDNPAAAPLRWPRPRMINFVRSHSLLIEGLTIQDAPFYACHLVYCQDVVVNRVTTIQSINEHNTAINIDSSKRVRVTGCTLKHGGDGVGIKAGYNEEGRRVNIPSEDILINNCQMFHNGDSAVAIGSETAAGIRDVVISNCMVTECTNGIYIRSPRGRGGVVEKIRVSNVVLDRIAHVGLRISHFFDSVRMGVVKGGSVRRDLEISRSRKAPVDEGTPTFRDFVFSGITMGRVGDVVLVEGLPERYVRGLSFQDIDVTAAAAGVSLALAGDVSVDNVTFGSLSATAVDAREVERLEIHRLRVPHPASEGPAVWLENVTGAFIHGCQVGPAGPDYQWLRQDQSGDVTMAGNVVPAVATPVRKKS
jgi:hypothetical protein